MSRPMLHALRLVLLPVAFGLPLVVSALPGDGIGGTDHDFSGIGSPPSGLCTFCHTPHKATTTQLLWNHTLSGNTFSWSASQTSAGTPYPSFAGDTYRGSTAKCLGCHDGSVAIGDLAWWNGGAPSPLLAATITGSARSATPAGDLSGNHPVAMPIPWNNQPSSYNGVTSGTGIVLANWQSNPENLGIRLFNDDGTGNIQPGPAPGRTGIECSSCHDPHNGAGVEDALFLRGTLSGICSKCHKM